MQNNLSDLNTHLFEMIERLGDDLDADRLEREVRRAEAVTRVSQQIIQVAHTQIMVIKTAEEAGILNDELPALLMTKDSRKEKNCRRLGHEEVH